MTKTVWGNGNKGPILLVADRIDRRVRSLLHVPISPEGKSRPFLSRGRVIHVRNGPKTDGPIR